MMNSDPEDVGNDLRSGSELDVGRLHRLVEDIEGEVSQLPQDAPTVRRLRADLEALKSELDNPTSLPQKAAMHGPLADRLRKLATSMEGEVLKDSRYVAEAGRILGLV